MHGARSSAGLLHPPGSGPNSFSCTWAHRRREPRCYFFTSPTLAPKLLAATLAPTSGRGRAVRPAQLRSARLGSARPGSAPFGPTRSRSAPLGSAPDRCVEPQRPLLGQSSAARPAAAERLRTGAAGHGAAWRWMELCRQGNTREVSAWCPVQERHAVGFAVLSPELWQC